MPFLLRDSFKTVFADLKGSKKLPNFGVMLPSKSKVWDIEHYKMRY